MSYAENTSVSVEKSRAEIERIITRYGASEFASGWRGDQAVIGFASKNRYLKFVLPLPRKDEKRFTHLKNGWTRRTESASIALWEASCRQKWRALCLAIKAKLEAVESGISTFEEEFMAHIVMNNGQTMGEIILPQLDSITDSSRLLPLLQ